jgi:hypothetical protein
MPVNPVLISEKNVFPGTDQVKILGLTQTLTEKPLGK